MKFFYLSVAAVCLSCSLLVAQNGNAASGGGTTSQVQMVITAEVLRGKDIPAPTAADIQITQEQRNLEITSVVPLVGENGRLDLMILIDDRLNPAQSALFDQLRNFVQNQGAQTSVGIAYMQNGEVRIVQFPTKDHVLAAQALRAPAGIESAGASPYASLSTLLRGWAPGTAPRREVLMITDGIDRFETFGDFNMSLDQAVADSQRVGVPVFAFYASALGHASHSPALIHWGQTYLGRLAEETGGEAYFNGPEPPATYEPYLADVAVHLASQYLVTFLAEPQPGERFQSVRFRSRIPGVELTAPYRFYLKERPSVP